MTVLSALVSSSVAEECSVLLTGQAFVASSSSADVDAESVPAVSAALRTLPAPTVWTGSPSSPWAGAFDVVVDPSELAPVVDAVAAQPQAALALVALLRASSAMAVPAAVAFESATYALLLGSDSYLRWLAARPPREVKPAVRPPVSVVLSGDVLAVTLDRPEARNAVDSAMRDAWVDAMRLAASLPGVAVELRGNGPCFSAGGDLDEFGHVPDPATAHAVRLTRHPGLAVHAVAEQVTAYLHGPCVGAGIEAPAFAGRVVADPGATFRLPELGFGLVPGAGGTVSIPRRIGRQRAGWMALTGAEVDAATALAWGLVDEVTPAVR